MKKILIIVGVVVAVFVAITVEFYSMAFNQLNMCFKSANNGVATEFEENEIISEKDYKAITVVSPVSQSVEYYINGGYMPKIKSIGYKTITIDCFPNYTVIDADSGKVIQSAKDIMCTVQMEFKNFKWTVSSATQYIVCH